MQPNKYGKYKREDVVKNGYKIYPADAGLLSATDLKKVFGLTVASEDRLEKCIGFVCGKGNYGCHPVFDPFKV